ncbi:MAG: NAD-dependent DNA ligase LigA, partial [archaeon]
MVKDKYKNVSFKLDSDIQKLNTEEAKKQVKELREIIKYHNHKYYVENNPIISDKKYDKLFYRLQELEEEFDLKDKNSPTQRVGGKPVDEFDTVNHTKEMLSLDSSEDKEDVKHFYNKLLEEVEENKVKLSVEPKFDGISIEIVYKNGEFKRAVTRGNGKKGDDISKNVKTIKSIPLTLPKNIDLSVRGEIIMKKDEFQNLNEKRIKEGKEPFANTRNATAGTVRQLNPKIVAKRPLDVFFYDILKSSVEVKSQKQVFELLKKLGFKICDLNNIVNNIEKFIDYRNKLQEKRENLNYDIDGVVTKVNDFDKREKIGKTSRFPKWAFAYKFPPKRKQTKIEKIITQVGRTGKLTPVALLNPVEIQGVTVSRATLHNESLIKERNISEGAIVKLERAGDVIPEVKEVVKKGDKDFKMPKKCPICKSKVIQEGEYHYCSGGLSCKVQLIQKIIHFASKKAMDIEGLGDKIVKQLVEENLISSLSDLYKLEKEDLIELERFAEKSTNNLLNQIKKSKNNNLDEFLFGLGIRHLGRERARELAKYYNIKELIKNVDKKDLLEIEDFGDQVVNSIIKFFNNDKNVKEVKEILNYTGDFEKLESDDELEEITFVFTGSVEGYSRTELKNIIEKKGGNVTSSVSSNTDYLIIGENPGKRKRKNAKK